MPKRFTYSLLAAVALLLLLTAPSALGAQGSRAASAHAVHRQQRHLHRHAHRPGKHARKARRRGSRVRRDHAAAVRRGWYWVGAPLNISPPTIGGTAVEGQTLSASMGSWSNNPTSYAYQWEACNALGEGCLPVSGGASAKFELVASDVHGTMRVVVTATSLGGSGKASSAATAVVTAASAPSSPPSSPTPPPTPPSTPAPVNTTIPAIGGVAEEGQTLSATAGGWSNSPTSYAYQWQSCNTVGEACANVGGAASSAYKLSSSAVGSTVRVVVTATNEGGSASAASAPSATVIADPQPPTAGFTYSPSSPHTGEAVTFNASSSTCPQGPCTYTWSDDGGTTRPIPPLWPLGSGQPLQFTFSAAGTKYVRLVVTDALGREGTVEHNVVVAEAPPSSPPPPPAAPVDTTPPTVSGSAVEGETLSVGTGAWTGSPTSYAYQWEDCNASGTGCSNIAGATGSKRVLASGDVGHTVRAVVKATNSGGSGEATSAATVTVAAKQQPVEEAKQPVEEVKQPVEEVSKEELGAIVPNLAAKQCFENPEVGTKKIEACGYPGLADTGVEKGVSLTAEKGTVTFKREEYINAKGEKKTGAYEGKRLEGEIYICPNANDVVIKNDEITNSGGKEPGGQLVRLESPETIVSPGCSGETHAAGPEHVTITHVRMTGKGPKEPEVAAECLRAWKAVQLHIEYSSTNYCDGMKINGGGRVEHDLCIDNAEFYTNGEEEHYECISDDGTSTSSEPTIFKDDTFFNTHYETAAIFLQGWAGSLGEVREEENFFAGGDYSLYGGNEDHASAGNVIVKNNRFARCLSKSCPDTHGYFEKGGYYGPVYPNDWPGISGPSTTARTTWENNFWDDSLALASEWP